MPVALSHVMEKVDRVLCGEGMLKLKRDDIDGDDVVPEGKKQTA